MLNLVKKYKSKGNSTQSKRIDKTHWLYTCRKAIILVTNRQTTREPTFGIELF